MNFTEALQLGVAVCYRDPEHTVYVFSLDTLQYEIRADVPAGLYEGTHPIEALLAQLRALGIPLDHGWEIFTRRNIRMNEEEIPHDACSHRSRVWIVEYGHLVIRTLFHNQAIEFSEQESDIDGRFRILCDECGFNQQYNAYGRKEIPSWVRHYYHHAGLAKKPDQGTS